jgi:hypothetical protein
LGAKDKNGAKTETNLNGLIGLKISQNTKRIALSKDFLVFCSF